MKLILELQLIWPQWLHDWGPLWTSGQHSWFDRSQLPLVGDMFRLDTSVYCNTEDRLDRIKW